MTSLMNTCHIPDKAGSSHSKVLSQLNMDVEVGSHPPHLPELQGSNYPHHHMTRPTLLSYQRDKDQIVPATT